MPELVMAEMTYKDRLKVELFPTIWCPGCGIGTIMMQLAMVLDEMGLDETNTVIVTGIGCTGRMGGYLKHEAVYTLHGRTLPVAETAYSLKRTWPFGHSTRPSGRNVAGDETRRRNKTTMVSKATPTSKPNSITIRCMIRDPHI